MPSYAGAGQATLLRENKQMFLFQQELIVAGRSSIAVQLERINRSFYPWGVSVQIYFTDVNGNPVAPGAFELDVQTSDIDQDSQYCLANAYTGTVMNGAFAGRVELLSFWAKYLRVRVTALTNAVYVSVLVTR
jgi:hypothetical protein